MIIVIMLLMDLYVFMGVRTVSQSSGEKTKIAIYGIYWVVSATAIVTILLFPYLQLFQNNIVFRNYVFAIIVGLFFAKIIASVFFLIDDIRRGAIWLMAKIFPKTGVDFVNEQNRISRSTFLSWTGLVFGGSLFTTLVYGFSNKYNYQLRKVQLSFYNLPPSFKGLKIVQISDIHSGSFTDKAAVDRGVDMVLKANPDLIFQWQRAIFRKIYKHSTCFSNVV